MLISVRMRWRYVRNRNRLVLIKMDFVRRQKRGFGDAARTLRFHKIEPTGAKKQGWMNRRQSWPKSWRAPNHVKKPSLARQRALDRQGVPF